MNGDLLVVVFHSLHLDSPSTANAPLFIRLSRNSSAQRVLEGDIKGCFDNINHEWLLDNVPMDKSVLKQFLEGWICV